LAQVLVGQTQKNGGTAVWFDAEGAFDKDWAEKMGVDVDKLVLPDFDFAEDAFAKALYCVQEGIDLIVIDSLAALQPKVWMEESDKGDGKDRRIGMSAKVVGQFCRDVVAGSKERPPLKETPTGVILINQLRDRFNVMFGDPTTTPGGWAPKFYASLRLEVKRVGIEKKDGKPYRQKIRIAVKKSKISPPFRECDLWLHWDGKFVDDGQGAMLIAKEKELILVAGAGWITWLPTGEKVQGAEALGRYLKESGEMSKITGE